MMAEHYDIDHKDDDDHRHDPKQGADTAIAGCTLLRHWRLDLLPPLPLLVLGGPLHRLLVGLLVLLGRLLGCSMCRLLVLQCSLLSSLVGCLVCPLSSLMRLLSGLLLLPGLHERLLAQEQRASACCGVYVTRAAGWWARVWLSLAL